MSTRKPCATHTNTPVIKSLTDPELAALFAANIVQPYKTIFLLMSDAGLRVNEAIQLNQSDLWLYHLPVQTLTLPSSITKNHLPRNIPTSLAIRLAIQSLHDNYWPDHLVDPDTQAFFAPHGPRSIKAIQVRRVLSRISMYALHRHVTPHQLRHTFATRLMRKVPIRVVQALLGHKSLSSTQIYTTPNNTDLHDAIESLSTETQQQAT